MKRSRTPAGKSRREGLVLLGLWLLACCVALAGVWVVQRSSRIAELTEESERLHAAVSQRADQHDAHLTALSAVAVAGAKQRPDLFREVAAAIMRFYPRVAGIALVHLEGDAGGIALGVPEEAIRESVRAAVRRSTGAPVLVASVSDDPEYLIVKRSPNTDAAQYGLALVIDAEALIAGESKYWNGEDVARALAMPDGTPLLAEGPAVAQPQVEMRLSSRTQPLKLRTAVSLHPADLLPPGRVVIALIAVTVAAVLIRFGLHQRARIRTAERQAELRGQEARLSHASRVNALGEMASGMAHELTQPLTAILAQTQAARRLAAQGETGRLAGILNDTIAQTKRASAILDRLRTWTQPHARQAEVVDFRVCATVAKTLLGQQADEIGATLTIRDMGRALPVLADRIELEQVMFNLIRNAFDAVEGVETVRAVTVTLSTEGGMVLADVQDTGPGVREDVRDRLFVPFVTTREAGTGLGLALSQRLVERAGGDLVLIETAAGARFRVSLPLAQECREAAE